MFSQNLESLGAMLNFKWAETYETIKKKFTGKNHLAMQAQVTNYLVTVHL